MKRLVPSIISKVLLSFRSTITWALSELTSFVALYSKFLRSFYVFRSSCWQFKFLILLVLDLYDDFIFWSLALSITFNGLIEFSWSSLLSWPPWYIFSHRVKDDIYGCFIDIMLWLIGLSYSIILVDIRPEAKILAKVSFTSSPDGRTGLLVGGDNTVLWKGSFDRVILLVIKLIGCWSISLLALLR